MSSYIDTEPKRKRLQQALIDHGFDVGPDGADGDLGRDTAKAIINARIAYKLDHQDKAEVDTDLMRELGLLAIQDPAIQSAGKLVAPQLFNNIAAILAVISALKGKTMTTDQITGIIRLVLGLIGGYFVSKGVVTQSAWDWLGAGVLTAIPALWSWYSNRPKVILSIADKAKL